jgi:ABC-type sulfate transport system permease component
MQVSKYATWPRTLLLSLCAVQVLLSIILLILAVVLASHDEDWENFWNPTDLTWAGEGNLPKTAM